MTLTFEEKLEPIGHPELFFGLVGSIGVDMAVVEATLTDALQRVGYATSVIKISELLNEVKLDNKIDKSQSLKDQYFAKMNAGNEYRKKTSRNDILALHALMRIRHERKSKTKDTEKPHRRQAYILTQFKREEEIATLRSVYGDCFFQISAYAPAESRMQHLAKRLAEKEYDRRSDSYYERQASELIERDEKESEDANGQRLSDTYPNADVIIDVTNISRCKETCSRAIDAIFGHPFITPTRDEFGIYLASAASLRSSALSRQVGAAIIDDCDRHIAMGCNEVPKAGGGTYWHGDDEDHRDFVRGYDSSTRTKVKMVSDIMGRLKDEDWLNEERKNKSIDELAKVSIHGSDEEKAILKGSRILDLLEFGREIHAEMNALSDAARFGHSTQRANLYCTTFPCHNCARHIIAAGIKKVVFIEPYAKSLASHLHDDSIEIDPSSTNGKKVTFVPFVGITPRSYNKIFRKFNRKDKHGNAHKWDPNSSQPVSRFFSAAFIAIENNATAQFEQILKDSNLKKATKSN